MNDDERSPLAVWQHNHDEATKVLADFARTGDVNWTEVLTNQEAMLDELLSAEDRRLARRRAHRTIH